MSFDINSLPISKNLTEISALLRKEPYLVLKAEPGAGKSTAVPLYLLKHLDLGGKKIIMLEPRRLAARSIAEFLAAQLDERVGQTVGYQVRNERKVSAATQLEIVTEGILNTRIQADPELHDIGLIIFDEFHERSIHADLGLSLCKEITQAYNESLKLLVMSATMDTEQLSGFLENAPVLQVEGRCFPVEVEYLAKPIDIHNRHAWQNALSDMILQSVKCHDGDILVFLPGQAEIKRTALRLQETLNENEVVVHPLYGNLTVEQQQQALLVDEQARQKIVLATNIAETSLTIDNITVVVDSGLERISEYDVTSGMNRLLTQRISRASAEQRAGRAGRVQAGYCYRLWTESQQQALIEFAKPQITQVELADLRMILAQWGVASTDEMEWITQPPKAHFEAANRLLQQLALMDSDGQLTTQGHVAVKIGLSPRLANIMVHAQATDDCIKSLAADLVAVLMDSHFYNAHDDADLASRMMALQDARSNRKQALKSYPLKAAVTEQVLKTATKMQRQLGMSKPYVYSLDDVREYTGGLLSYAYPDRIAKLRSTSSHDCARYLLANGRGAVLDSSNVLKPEKWLVIADLDGQKKDGRIFLAAEVDASSLENYPGFRIETVYDYDQQTQKIRAQEHICLGNIIVEKREAKLPDKAQIKNCIRKILLDTKLEILPWNKAIKMWRNRLLWLAEMAPEETKSWPDFDNQSLMQTLDEWLIPYVQQVDSIQALKTIDLQGLLSAHLGYENEQQLVQQAPEVYAAPNGKSVPIEYQLGQLPKVSLRLQAVFGELSSPKLAWGKQRLSFELLSPAQRPIQTTSDLAYFWQNSYVEVAKEMRGRYPKHRWPEEPLLETPGHSLKKR